MAKEELKPCTHTDQCLALNEYYECKQELHEDPSGQMLFC
jgi:hypothetical protein